MYTMGCSCPWCPGGRRALKLRVALTSALLFIIIGSPATYQVVQKLLGRVITIASGSGLPTTAGLLVHAVVFALAVLLLMKLKKRRGGGYNRYSY